MFLSEHCGVELLAVLSLQWKETVPVDVPGRPFCALSLRLRGDAEVVEGDRAATLSTGTVTYMPHDADYSIRSGEEELIVVHFLLKGDHSRRLEVFSPARPAEAQRLFSLMLSVWSQREPGYYFRCLSLFYALIAELSASEDATEQRAYEKIRASVEYLHLHYTDPSLTVRSLCARSFLSDTHFRRLFFEVFGMMPLQYLNALRIDYARALLRERNVPIEEAARLCGFGDAKYFCSLFRRAVGVSPSQYRKDPF